MIDVSNLVVRVVKESLSEFPDVKVYSNFIDETEKLPAVTVYEVSNEIDKRTMDSDGAEHYANVVYEVAVYTDNSNGKQLAKKMFTTINDALVSINFVRSFKGELPNIDRTVFRILGRYEARVSEDIARGDDVINKIYRR